MIFEYDADYDFSDLKAEALFERRRMAQYLAHPDPRDPDYPAFEEEEEYHESRV